ncbi:DNA processing protein [Propionicimonas paludicola]|uniref:DNA processing protein n=1 Tax=Propionicimonas paludicola TaxID=185243 RepID=A0A2A9CQQ9_9ACTN|nr:DNA-processing protein DprA [Propionicimonas paludicola]PFG16456.1 DNA processing protein [Propionicimonas paludicola]
MDERLARMCLAAVVEPGRPGVGRLLDEFGAEATWQAMVTGAESSTLAQRARRVDPEALAAATRSLGLRFLTPSDPQWPTRLGDLEDCEPVNELSGVPIGLWLGGPADLAELCHKAVSIVGSRASTGYGDTVAAEIAAELSEGGRTVISGGAYGIDAAAHRGCLAGRSPSIAVLAGGLDEAYPSGHRPLFERIAEKGLLVSELAPGEHPTRVRFLARNRLIAALSPGTVLVEAAARSGARNTVTWANVLARVVMAVPGPVTSATSVTPHRLIRDAEAILVSCAADIVELLDPMGRARRWDSGDHRVTDGLDPTLLRLFEVIPGRGSLPASELALRADCSLPACLAGLEELIQLQLVAQDPSGAWRLAPGVTRRRTAG